MKTYHPDLPANRTLANFEQTSRSYLRQLDEADLNHLTEILQKNGVNSDLTQGQKVLTLVVKEGQWDVSLLEGIEKNLKQINPQYQNIVINIEIF